MNFREYGDAAATTAIYPGRLTWGGMLYCVSELCGEIGECLNVVKKIHREGFSEKYKEKLTGELGGVMWSWSQIWYEAGMERFLSDIKVEEINIENMPPSATWMAGVDENVIHMNVVFGELNRIANKLHIAVIDDEHCDHIAELSCFPQYISGLCTLVGIDFEVVMEENLALLKARTEAGTLTGSGDGVEGRNDG